MLYTHTKHAKTLQKMNARPRSIAHSRIAYNVDLDFLFLDSLSSYTHTHTYFIYLNTNGLNQTIEYARPLARSLSRALAHSLHGHTFFICVLVIAVVTVLLVDVHWWYGCFIVVAFWFHC